jgi:hypothetical protein
VTTICQACHIAGGSFTPYCLSKSLTHQLNSLKYTSVTAALIDISHLLCKYRQQLLILEHHCTIDVKFLNFADEFDTSQPHCEQESLAAVITEQQELISLPLPQLEYINPPHNDILLYHEGRPLVSKIALIIKCALYSTAIRHTICKQENWTEVQFSSVDWPAHEVAYWLAWSCTRITYTKLSHKLLNTNVQNHRFYGKSHQCPCCNVLSETLLHVFTCSALDVITF